MNNIKLSFLILTHNRPKLFKRCIESILQFDFPFNIEILINNDSNDIIEIYKTNIQIKYFYEINTNLSKIYKFLYNKANGEYIYYLEDDDYLSRNFLNNLNICSDILYMNYKKFDNKLNFEPFKIETKNKHFQLSQILFKKELLTLDEIPDNNDLDNDWKIFQSLINKTNKINIIKNIMFIQTCDGKDNISFLQFNKDNRWNTLDKVE